ncbi:MAG: T9SS type A sorting domain-containing protein [Bacteroidetes bacterium]|nr:MAG: T9SS type A sorting domain-containing protein [Bacteroidota bacterium]
MRKYVAILFVFFGLSEIFAQPFLGEEKLEIEAYRGASCTPPSASTFLETNNVRALIHTAGNLWQIPGQNLAQYEVPKNSGIMAAFTSALWLGGTDVNGQLKLAALRYRNGQDYWTGPLKKDEATTDGEVCEAYDRHFVSRQDQVREFDAWFEAGIRDQKEGTNLQAELFPNYEIPLFIKEWPAHGDVSLGQDYYLAPFFDRNEDGDYRWEDGDYPWYDFKKDKTCRVDREVSLYGDENFWWIMNDKGNIHTETGADPIGMEIRAQAFAFSTNDEINNMTFYNYELINRSTQTLYQTYFGVFMDGALGDPFDDYVGCDVNRGLGYIYNGDGYDGDNQGFKGYGDNPPALGVDFFEGPYQDNDGIDNAIGIGPNEALNGIGFGDGVVDNERFGMRRFLYYVNTGSSANVNQTDPQKATDYYNYLRGRWKDGTPFFYGGSGYFADPNADQNIPCEFLFPGDTDPLGWGTGGVPQPVWTEETAGNEPYDRRFLQSAGPFVLKPGAVNNITVGVVWAKAGEGGPFESVKKLQLADDKAQALFENCFKILDAPNAPDLFAQELNQEVILMIQNPVNSNNYKEGYEEADPFIVSEDPDVDRVYKFQGYMVYQLKDATISVSDIEDPTKARLVAQCDLKDGISRLVNFEFDQQLGASIPVEKVLGADEGIRHSFRLTEDQFAQGDRTLVNFKKYYYLAIAYAYNQYKEYDPGDPAKLDGQKKPFLPSRKATLGEVSVVEVMPHDPKPEAGGTLHYLEYGSSPEIIRLDGRGNGNRSVELTQESIDYIIEKGYQKNPRYEKGAGPIHIKVIDPLNVVPGYFVCKFRDYQNKGTDESVNYEGVDTASWVIYRYDSEGGSILDSIQSEQSIEVSNEQLVPEWGISVEIYQNQYIEVPATSGFEFRRYTSPIEATIEYEDSTRQWLSFVKDDGAFFPTNWIRSSDYEPQAGDDNPDLGVENPACYPDEIGKDLNNSYAKLLGGGIAPHTLVGYQCDYMPLAYPSPSVASETRKRAGISRIPSVDIVITNDKSKWTRCAVIELGRDENLNVGGVAAGELRGSLSVNKEGNPDGSGSVGMGWFPGYAIDVETGMRLHMAFGENSFLGGENGSDMIWNPTSNLVNSTGGPLMGGLQPVYVFGYKVHNEINDADECPFYDGVNNWVYDKFKEGTTGSGMQVYQSLVWVMNPMLANGQQLLSNDLRIKVRVNKEYNDFVATGSNGGRPMYAWSTEELSTRYEQTTAEVEALSMINVVPNPYYAYSEYERSRLDTRVRIINLPRTCTVKIYNVTGKLVNTYKKDNALTYLDWTLENYANVPVASGTYLIHVSVPDVGETVLKSFIGARQPDLDGF